MKHHQIWYQCQCRCLQHLLACHAAAAINYMVMHDELLSAMLACMTLVMVQGAAFDMPMVLLHSQQILAVQHAIGAAGGPPEALTCVNGCAGWVSDP
jgi:hypothetical protein